MTRSARGVLAFSICLLIAGCEPADRPATNGDDEDQRQRMDEIIDAYAEAWNTGDLAALDTLVASGFRRHFSDTTITGRDGLAQNVEMNHQAFSNLNVRLHERVIDGELAAVRYHLTGTNDGSMMGAPPTNQRMDLWGISIIRVSGNEIQEEWTAFDQATMMRQLGLMQQPAPTQPPTGVPPEEPVETPD